jgi:hypothetical protein
MGERNEDHLGAIRIGVKMEIENLGSGKSTIQRYSDRWSVDRTPLNPATIRFFQLINSFNFSCILTPRRSYLASRLTVLFRRLRFAKEFLNQRR